MSHKNWGLLLLAAAALMYAPLNVSADPPLDSAEQKILDHFVGNWRTTYKSCKSEWAPYEKSGTADLVTGRAVGGRFIQEKSEHSDKTSGTSILTYDDQRKCYRSWWFSSSGQMSESLGQWDAATSTMIWTALKDDLTSTTRHHFLDDDNAQWSVAVKDSRGKVYFRMEGTSVRTPAQK